MITTAAVSVAISITKGLIKLSKEADLIYAEKGAVDGKMELPAPDLTLAPTNEVMKGGLKALIKYPGQVNEAEVAEIRAVLSTPTKQKLQDLVKRHLPELASGIHLDLNAVFIKELKKFRPSWAADPQMLIAAFSVAQGSDDRSKSYTWRLALTVVDVLTEFGAENTALFTRNPQVQGIVESVLRRFGESDLQKIDSSQGVVRAALAATLNGALDSNAKLDLKNPWLDGLLDALVAARDSVPAASQDEFLVGLLRGKGYPALVAGVLQTAAGKINEDEVTDFRDVTADFLISVAEIVRTETDFDEFFENHWGDMVRAALSSVSTHGPALLGDKKLLGEILKQVAADLAKHGDSKLLSADSLYGIINSTAAVVAANPNLAVDLFGTDKVWVDQLVVSVAATVKDAGIRKVFTQEGVESLFKDAFATFARQPELLVKDSKLAAALVGGILTKLSETQGFAVRELATAAVSGALTALAANPALVDFEYPELLASFAGRIATLVGEKKLTGVQATEVLQAGLASLSENPTLFMALESKLGEEVVALIVRAAGKRPGVLVAGVMLSQITREALSALARSGKAALQNVVAAELLTQLQALLDAGLVRAEKELGHTLALPSLPPVIGLLIEAWAKGNVSQIDPENDNFKKLFVELTARANA